MISDAYENIKGSNTGEIPAHVIDTVCVLVWRTLVTYAIKMFLDGGCGKGEKGRERKQHFSQFLAIVYEAFKIKTCLEEVEK